MTFPSTIHHLEADGFSYLYMQDRCSKSVPKIKGIYCLVAHDIFDYRKITVVYVGKTINACSRLKYPHPAEHEYGSYLSAYILESNEIDQLEVDFIKRYRPLLNIQHNG